MWLLDSKVYFQAAVSSTFQRWKQFYSGHASHGAFLRICGIVVALRHNIKKSSRWHSFQYLGILRRRSVLLACLNTWFNGGTQVSTNLSWHSYLDQRSTMSWYICMVQFWIFTLYLIYLQSEQGTFPYNESWDPFWSQAETKP